MSLYSLYRQKPHIVEARRFLTCDAKEQKELAEWCGGFLYYLPAGGEDQWIIFRSPLGESGAQYGDWIIKDRKGDFYPRSDDDFQEGYERVEDVT